MNRNEEQLKRKRAVLTVMCVIVGLLLTGTVVFAAFMKQLYERTSYETEPESIVISTEIERELQVETLESSLEEKILEEQRSLRESLEETTEKESPEETSGTVEETTEPESTDHVQRILLIGVDRRDASWNGNSDVMILCTINYTDQTVTLTSFMRDLGVSIEGVGVRKLNHAFALGGGPLLVRTIQDNFLISIDNYAWVDFEGTRAIIDRLGGVDMELTEAEAKYIGIDITGTQVVHLDGEHALLHARNRSVGGTSDYGRTQRQRNVILAVVQKARSGGIGDLAAAANEILPYINHNMDQSVLMSLIMDLPAIKDYEFRQQRVPFDNMYHSQSEYLIPDFKATIEKLRETLY